MNPITTRVLGAENFAELRQMIGVFGEAFEDNDTYTAKQPDDAYLIGLLTNPNFAAIAAFHGQFVIGGLAGYVLPKFEQARSEFYIYDLAVKAEHRRLGIATAMIEELKHFASRRGIYVIFVQANYGDDPAISLYTKLGAREDVLHFDIAPHKSGG